MDKIYLDSIECSDNPIIITETNKIYHLDNGNYLKIRKKTNCNNLEIKKIEQKILYADKIHDLKHLVKPIRIVYSNKSNPVYIGYEMRAVDGVNFDEKGIISKEEDKYNLQRYAELYLKAEQTVKEANAQGIIMPDMLSENNILINKNEEIEFIDYDDMQIGALSCSTISDVYDEIDENGICRINLPYKYYKNGLLNNNIDKKSLFYIYLENTFNLTPEEVQMLGNNKNLMQYLGIHDDNIENKFGVFFDDNPKVDNEYLGSTTIDIANKYELRPGRHDTKSLYKKR